MDSSFLVDDLYCQENDAWKDDDEIDQFQDESGVYSEHDSSNNNIDENLKVFPSLLILLEQDMFWDDDELVSLFSKEKEQESFCEAVFFVRREAVEWMLKVSACYGFSILTSVLAINYLDRFFCYFKYKRDEPWMIQLVAVSCLSLAAKVEETHVPLLLDLQVGGTKYVFEAKAIQRLELLLLSKLKWKMHPVTPLSFLDHIVRRLGFKSNTHWEFFQQCEKLILSVVADSRFIGYLPSVIASAAMMHVIDQVDHCNAPEYQDQLLNVLKISKENVNECYGLILELQKDKINDCINPQKRKYDHLRSPFGVNDVSFSCDDNSCSSCWFVESSSPCSSSSSSSEPLTKKSKTQEKQMTLPSLNRVFIDIGNSPP